MLNGTNLLQILQKILQMLQKKIDWHNLLTYVKKFSQNPKSYIYILYYFNIYIIKSCVTDCVTSCVVGCVADHIKASINQHQKCVTSCATGCVVECVVSMLHFGVSI